MDLQGFVIAVNGGVEVPEFVVTTAKIEPVFCTAAGVSTLFENLEQVFEPALCIALSISPSRTFRRGSGVDRDSEMAASR